MHSLIILITGSRRINKCHNPFQGRVFSYLLLSVFVIQFSISDRSGHHTIKTKRDNEGFSLCRRARIEIKP